MRTPRFTLMLVLCATVMAARGEEMVTAIYPVPGFSSLIGTSSSRAVDVAGVEVQSFDARPYLEPVGVEFPPGSRAEFVREGEFLVIRDTRENVSLVKVFAEYASLPQVGIVTEFSLVSFRMRGALPEGAGYDRIRREAGDSWRVLKTLEYVSLDVKRVGPTSVERQEVSESERAFVVPQGGAEATAVIDAGVDVDERKAYLGFHYQFRGEVNRKALEVRLQGRLILSDEKPYVLRVIPGAEGEDSLALVVRASIKPKRTLASR